MENIFIYFRKIYGYWRYFCVEPTYLISYITIPTIFMGSFDILKEKYASVEKHQINSYQTLSQFYKTEKRN